MPAETAVGLIVDCGTMVGHQQRELELPRPTVPFFGVDVRGAHSAYIRVRFSNGSSGFLRIIFRSDNGMWRVEFTTDVPEIDALIPHGTRRSDHAAIFEKVGAEDSAEYKLSFVRVGTPDYDAAFARTTFQDRTRPGDEGRNFGWW